MSLCIDDLDWTPVNSMDDTTVVGEESILGAPPGLELYFPPTHRFAVG